MPWNICTVGSGESSKDSSSLGGTGQNRLLSFSESVSASTKHIVHKGRCYVDVYAPSSGNALKERILIFQSHRCCFSPEICKLTLTQISGPFFSFSFFFTFSGNFTLQFLALIHNKELIHRKNLGGCVCPAALKFPDRPRPSRPLPAQPMCDSDSAGGG